MWKVRGSGFEAKKGFRVESLGCRGFDCGFWDACLGFGDAGALV